MEFNHRASEFKHERSSNVGEWFDGKTRGFKMWYDRELSYSDDVTGMMEMEVLERAKSSSYSVGSDVMAIVMSTRLRKTSLECLSK